MSTLNIAALFSLLLLPLVKELIIRWINSISRSKTLQVVCVVEVSTDLKFDNIIAFYDYEKINYLQFKAVPLILI